MDEMRKFSSENTLEPDEWTEPVVRFNKPAVSQTSTSRAAGGQPKPKKKPMLTIGVQEEEKMMPNDPRAMHPPPQRPVE